MKQYTGKQYLQIDLANHYGLDKISFEDRITWTENHEKSLEQDVLNAKDAFRFAAAVMAYRKMQHGQPIGYLVGLDSCASGIQIMSAVTQDPVGCANTGLIGQTREDVYHKATEVMNQLLEQTGTDYKRNIVKAALMCHFYGSKAEPKKAFGKDTPELIAFYEAQAIVAPGAAQLREILLNAWQPDTLSHDWIMPDNHHVHIPVLESFTSKIEVDELDHATFNYIHTENVAMEKGISLPANVVHSIDGYICREMGRRCNYNSVKLRRAEIILKKHLANPTLSIPDGNATELLYEGTGMLSLAAIEKLTHYSVKEFSQMFTAKLLTLVKKTLAKPSFPIIFLHDEFRCHPNNMNYVRQTYIDLFAELADGELISYILKHITDHFIVIEKYAPDISKLIQKSEYSIS